MKRTHTTLLATTWLACLGGCLDLGSLPDDSLEPARGSRDAEVEEGRAPADAGVDVRDAGDPGAARDASATTLEPKTPIDTSGAMQDAYYLSNCSAGSVLSSEVDWYADASHARTGAAPTAVAPQKTDGWLTWETSEVVSRFEDGASFASTTPSYDGEIGSRVGSGRNQHSEYACFKAVRGQLFESDGKTCDPIYECKFISFSTSPQQGLLPTAESPRLAANLARVLMRELQLSKGHAAALVGNLWVESAGLNANINQFYMHDAQGGPGAPTSDVTQGYGWAQWTYDRKTTFLAFTKSRSLDPASAAANYAFLSEELRGSHARALRTLKSTSSLEAAVHAFCAAFSNPEVPNVEARLVAAQAVLPLI